MVPNTRETSAATAAAWRAAPWSPEFLDLARRGRGDFRGPGLGRGQDFGLGILAHPGQIILELGLALLNPGLGLALQGQRLLLGLGYRGLSFVVRDHDFCQIR